MVGVGVRGVLIRDEHVEVSFGVETWRATMGVGDVGSFSCRMYSEVVRLRVTLGHMSFGVELYSSLQVFFSFLFLEQAMTVFCALFRWSLLGSEARSYYGYQTQSSNEYHSLDNIHNVLMRRLSRLTHNIPQRYLLGLLYFKTWL